MFQKETYKFVEEKKLTKLENERKNKEKLQENRDYCSFLETFI